MATKTDRILSYLPGTFRPLPRPTALYAVVDAFGNELLLGENSLSAVMRAHWVDHADRGAEFIEDLARMAALYCLAPHPDETVEEFREHLKRYIRTFLEGTVTVQGILRVTAEALGLRIADAYKDMDTWWTREGNGLITVEPRGDDAAEKVFGFKMKKAVGSPALSAQVKGKVDLSGGVDLQGTSTLRLKIDNKNPKEVNLVEGVEDPSSVTLNEVENAINEALGKTVASHDNGFLIIQSPTAGTASWLEIQDVANDAADKILGLAPRSYHGSDATAAQVVGAVDLSDGINLTGKRYLRMSVDGTYLAEIDCAGPDPEETTLDQICNAINTGIGIDVASHDNHFLTITSPTKGSGSSIAFQKPAAQDATVPLFGQASYFHTGRDAQPARLTGRCDLSWGADLSERSKIQLGIDGAASVMIDCAGEEPGNTRPAEITAKINQALGKDVASHNGRFIILRSPSVGADGEIIVKTPPSGDATEEIFGIYPRIFEGSAAAAARIVGLTDLSEGIDLMALRFLNLAVDNGPLKEIDLAAHAENPRSVILDELVSAFNCALGINIASHDAKHLFLESPTKGDASSLAIEPLETTVRRRFVSRAAVTDEATQAIFGFISREARGKAGTIAQIIGKADLSRGVNLSEVRYLRLSIDGCQAVDIDCAGQRPRATLIHEVVERINSGLGQDVAAHDGRYLMLSSPSTGTGSRIAIEPPRASDALDVLLGIEAGTYRGQDATKVIFISTVDLRNGIDLEANAAIRVGIDEIEPEDILFTNTETEHKTLNQIVTAINMKLGEIVASHDGVHIILTSLEKGEASRLEFAVPDGTDVTTSIFGITPPRSYHGDEAAHAKAIGRKDISGGANLQVARFLSLSVDGGQAVDVDCAGKANDISNVTLDEIIEAINDALGVEVASAEGGYLKLTSPTAGLSGRIILDHYTTSDARKELLGDVKGVVTGEDPSAAVITGEVDLLGPVDLSERRLIRLAVNGNRPVDINVAGAAPATTFLDEISTAINAVFPGMAEATEDDHLQLTSPTVGEDSRLSLLPLRYLELIEYPPETAEISLQEVRHGKSWSIVNDGASDVFAEIYLKAPQGVAGPTLVNSTLIWHIRVLTILNTGETLRLWYDTKKALQAEIISLGGDARPVPESRILVGPLGPQAWVPFEGTWNLKCDSDNPATLQLNNPLAPGIVILSTKKRSITIREIIVTVIESDLTAFDQEPILAEGNPASLVGRIRANEKAYRLVDANENVIVHLRSGRGVNLSAYQDRVVTVTGPLHNGEPPLLIVKEIAALFDVTLHSEPEGEEPEDYHYKGVTIGNGTQRPDSLVWQVNLGPHFSRLAKADEFDKGTVLTLPCGRSYWFYSECEGSRFNRVRFNEAYFTGGQCIDRGVFNVSRFTNLPYEPVKTVFASSVPLKDLFIEVSFQWKSHQPGAFVVNLPKDLPARFGGRFNEARFGQGLDNQGNIKPELYKKAVTEPPGDENLLVKLINEGRPDGHPPIMPSTLVRAEVVPFVPLGFEPARMPFRKPRFLTLGTDDEPGRLFLGEAGLKGFIEIKARAPGTWSNEIAVSARQSGPAMYDVSIIYQGSRFENARQVTLGTPLETLSKELLKPGPVGVLQAKAAGIRADVTRNRSSIRC